MYGCTRYATCASTFAWNRPATDAHFAPSNTVKVGVGPERNKFCKRSTRFVASGTADYLATAHNAPQVSENSGHLAGQKLQPGNIGFAPVAATVI